jgi:hypothetical protein
MMKLGTIRYQVCIDDLIGHRARAKGCRCECPKCWRKKCVNEEKLARLDFKMAAANDVREG